MYNTRKCEFTIELFDLLTILNVNFQNKHVLKKIKEHLAHKSIIQKQKFFKKTYRNRRL